MLTLEDVVQLHLTDWIAPDTHPLRGQEGECFAYVVRHPAGLILFETGFGTDSVQIDEIYRTTHKSLEVELARQGHQTHDVRAVVNSHLHFDHCGNNLLFPGVPIYVQTEEYRAAHEADYTVQRWVDFPGADYHKIDGDREIATGVKILSTRGHSPGHQSLLVETNSGPVILVGQAMYSPTEYEHIRNTGRLSPEDPPDDPAHYLESAQRLISLQGRRVYFSHDRGARESGN